MGALQTYAQADAEAAGLLAPNPGTPEVLAAFMSKAGNVLFLPGDPNLDNQKRNIAIQVFLSFEMSEIIAFGRAWLQKWIRNSHTRWHQEWTLILDRGDPAEITDILLSHHQDRMRQRLSMPFAEMLDFSVVLAIKRKTRNEEI